MGKKKMKDRSKLKAFLRVYNYNHLMPTRYFEVVVYYNNSTICRNFTICKVLLLPVLKPTSNLNNFVLQLMRINWFKVTYFRD